MKYLIEHNETLDDLMCGYKIVQNANMFRFSLDAVLLAHFATIKKGDMVVAISASGNSPNLLQAIDIAKQKKAITVGLVAFDGGKLKKMTDKSIHVPTLKGEYGPSEDAHMMLDHLVSNYLIQYVKD